MPRSGLGAQTANIFGKFSPIADSSGQNRNPEINQSIMNHDGLAKSVAHGLLASLN
jgi:hypothetical protein